MTCTYDALDRLVKVVYTDGTTIDYTYDAVGNRLSQTVTIGGTPRPFTDAPLTPGSSIIRALHIGELRTRIEAVRTRNGLPAFAYTNASISAGTSVMRAVDITEMRVALSQAYILAGLAPPSFSTTASSGAMIRVAEIAELRAAVVAIE